MLHISVSSDPPPPYTPPESGKSSGRSNSAEATGIHHSFSDQGLAQSQHRHSLPYETRPVAGRRQSCDPRLSSSSDSNMCQMNQYAEGSNIPAVSSSQSLARERNSYSQQDIMRENSRSSVSSQGSGQGVASLAQNIASSVEGIALSDQAMASPPPLSPTNPFVQGASHNIIHQQPAETIIHTNVVQIRQVVDLPPYEETGTKSRQSLGPEYTAGARNPERTTGENSGNSAGFEENFQFADDDNGSIPEGVTCLNH